MNDIKTRLFQIPAGNVYIEDRGYSFDFFHVFNHRPSWRNYGEGIASFRASLHRPSQTLMFDVSEIPEERRGEKRIIVTLSTEAMKELYLVLKSELEPKA